MSEATPIRVPLENVNDETVKLLAWAVKEGQEVRDGQLLAELETSKAVVEMIAPHSGKIWLKVQAGQEVPVGVILAYITTNGATVPPISPERAESSAFFEKNVSIASIKDPALPSNTSFSKRALELLERHALSPEVFTGKSMVRERDVKDYLAGQATVNNGGTSLHFALQGLCLENVSLPDNIGPCDIGVVDPSFLEKLRADSVAFAALPSSEKCDLYRKHGADIGQGVILDKGSVVIAPKITIGDGARFGESASVICRDRFAVGKLTSFRSGLNVRGGTVALGENIFAGQNIRIGGGGNGDPWSLLAVGNDTYLGDDLFLNICQPIVIGKEVFLTQRSVLVTHNIGHSVLEGYENRFASIVLEDYSQVGMNCTIYAGSWIGRYAIIGSNSYVVSSIPAGKMAIGIPARVVRDAARSLDRARQLQIAQTMVQEYRQLLELKGCQVFSSSEIPHLRFSVRYNDKKFQLAFVESLPDSGMTMEAADETILWTFDSPRAVPPAGTTVMNLLSKRISGPSGLFVNSTREFLRKRGIRCQPGSWRYEGGLI